VTSLPQHGEENFAEAIREVAKLLQKAEVEVAKTEADLKKIIAKSMVRAELSGQKTAAAQARSADEDDEVYEARVAHGVAKGNLAYAKAELKARETAFEYWRTKTATMRAERRVYSA
jgi:glucose-6-phosphate isomerase